MKILQLISSSGPYGAESMVVALTRELNARGCDCRLMLIENRHRRDPQVSALAARHGVMPEALPCRGRWDGQAIRRLRSYLCEEGIEVLHAHGYKARLFAWRAARGLTVRLATTCHGFVHDTLALKIYDRMDRWTLRRFPRVAAVSDDMSRQLREYGISSAALSTIANGVDLDRFRDAQPTLRAELNPPGPLLGAVGRLSPEKGLDGLLHAAAELAARFPEVRWALVGDGPQRGALEQLTSKLGIADRVIFTGRREDMPGVYASLDALLLPSLDEGLPMVVLEAMAAGRPVLASRVGAIGHVIRDGENGLLAPPGDVEALRGAIERLLAEPGLGARLGAAARATIEDRFSAAQMAAAYLQLYGDMNLSRAQEPFPAAIGAIR
ncbi:MAG: glycosyltransferase family 4 protein [Terriglobales bacterium]